MNRWKLTFEYDGGSFKGWQKQPGQRTAEGEIEKALSMLYQTDIDIIGQGRTDAGVHARAQTAHADLPKNFPEKKLLHAMKGLLPPDIALLEATQTRSEFHARFDVTSRRYSYRLVNRKSPLLRNYVWCCDYKLNQVALTELASAVMGEHDFINFCIPQLRSELTTICSITESRWEQEDEFWSYYIEGNRFLRHMVRRLVGSMVYVASNRLKLSKFYALLDGEEVMQKGHSAPAHGLCLDKVSYS